MPLNSYTQCLISKKTSRNTSDTQKTLKNMQIRCKLRHFEQKARKYSKTQCLGLIFDAQVQKKAENDKPFKKMQMFKEKAFNFTLFN